MAASDDVANRCLSLNALLRSLSQPALTKTDERAMAALALHMEAIELLLDTYIAPTRSASLGQSYTVRPSTIFEDDEEARKFFEAVRWPEGTNCLNCRCPNCQFQPSAAVYRCLACRRTFSVRSGTILSSSKLSYAALAVLIAESVRPLSQPEMIGLSKRVGASTTAVSDLIKKIRGVGDDWLERLVAKIVRASQANID